MTAVPPASRFAMIRASTKARLCRRSCRKVSVAAADVVVDVTAQSNKDSEDAGFCGDSFAERGELLASLTPLLFSLKLLGLVGCDLMSFCSTN